MPGSGKDAASASTASRSSRDSRRQVSIVTLPCARRHVPTISPSTRTAPGQTRDVQSAPRRSASTTSSSRSSPCRRKKASPLGRRRGGWHWPGNGAERCLVPSEDPRIPNRSSHRGQRPAKRIERGDAQPRSDPCPDCERFGGAGTEDMQIATCQLEASLTGSTSGGRPSRWSAVERRPTGSPPCR